MFTFSNDASVGAVGFVLSKLQQNPAKFKELLIQAENQKQLSTNNKKEINQNSLTELNQLKEDSSKFSINNTPQTPTVTHVQTKEQTSTNSNPLTNCTPEDFNSTKKVLKAALDSNPDLHTSNTLQNFIKNELPKLEKQTDALLKEELINQTKNRFNLLLERASSSTDVSVIYKALDLIDSLAYPNFEWDTTQVNLLYKKLND